MLGCVWTDDLILATELSHLDAATLSCWQDGLHRNDGYRQVAMALGVWRDDVLDAERRLIDRGYVDVRTGGFKANSRRLSQIDARFDRRGAAHFVLIPSDLLAALRDASPRNRPLALRYLALMCRAQIIGGAAMLSDAEAASLLAETLRSIRGTRQKLVRAGILVLHDHWNGQPIWTIPGAFVKPDADRFRPDHVPQDVDPEPIHTPDDEDLKTFLDRLDEEGGYAQAGQGVTPKQARGLRLSRPQGDAQAGQSPTTDSPTLPTIERASRVEDEDDVLVSPAQSPTKDDAALARAAGNGGAGESDQPWTPPPSPVIPSGHGMTKSQLRAWAARQTDLPF